MRSRSSFFGIALVLALVAAPTAMGQVTWFRVEDGTSNPVLDPYWDSLDGDPSMATLGTGPTLTGDYAFVNFDDDNPSDKIKVRRSLSPFDGSGNTTCAILRVNSGGSSGNYGFEHYDTFGMMTVTLRKNETDNNGFVRFPDVAPSGIELPVTNITDWHVYWFTQDPAGNTLRMWVDPDGSDTTQGTADLAGIVSSSTGNRITWGTESSGQLMNYDVDLAKWALGVHAPADDLPTLASPTPTPTGTLPTFTPTVTHTFTPTFTVTPTFTLVPNQPKVELSMIRQVGCYENQNCTGGGMMVIYVHFSHANGGRLSGGNVWMRVNGGSEQLIGTTGSDLFAPKDWLQYSFPLYPDPPMDYVEVRMEYNGIWSDYTPILYRDVPPYAPLYSWELFYVYSPDTVTRPHDIVYNLDRDYDHAQVQLNTATGTAPGYNSDNFQIIGTAATNSYSQTFVANGNRIISAKCFVTTNFMALVQYKATIHDGGISGPQIGGAAYSPSYLSVEYPKITVFWPLEGPDSVPVIPGNTYAIRFEKVPAGTTGAYSVHHNVSNSYPDGDMYRDGVIMSPAVDILGIVVSADALEATATPTVPPEGTPTATETPLEPSTGVEERWKYY